MKSYTHKLRRKNIISPRVAKCKKKQTTIFRSALFSQNWNVREWRNNEDGPPRPDGVPSHVVPVRRYPVQLNFLGRGNSHRVFICSPDSAAPCRFYLQMLSRAVIRALVIVCSWRDVSAGRFMERSLGFGVLLFLIKDTIRVTVFTEIDGRHLLAPLIGKHKRRNNPYTYVCWPVIEWRL